MGGDGFKMPEAPVLAAGAFGGPFVMYLVTPCRNALTFAAQDAKSSFSGVFRQVFARGLAGGWKGGMYPAIAACPQYLCLGPAYHMYASAVGPVGGIVLAGITETAVLYGAETKNAHLATNARRPGRIPEARVQSPFNPWGPGVMINLARNIFAMSGMRVINEPIANAIAKASGGSQSGLVTLASDLTANCCAAGITMPMHMLYQYVCTSGPELWDKPQGEQVTMMKTWLREQYFPGGRLSPVIVRDLGLRAGYIATAYTIYMQIERAAVKYWPF
mmetsp:Transcript_49263/g.139102  ORF Transcript_49263/g.139102 Transcript_49263/m.139102 type:complete len:275 (+) Transcript_49263:58-882(+)|eukprot:CAMPEP_0179250780 /NCGR_PEP_ID=MMETSP0797-20121207/21347_1 /TAXON_ID=47934 /ORGANISM="Dinophysis acuminata, Strain DAEP01" /LENGTH=274 /DNA_ID=CAMNT_0020958533 /DNA_START=53 /DNA_END=877 /DNA_ORIENTATION=+